MNQIIIATKNQGKAKEFNDFFAPFGWNAISLLDLPETIPDVEETGTTFEENAALKAETIANRMGTPVLADDSGLVIDALDGQPGIYSARYAGLEKNDQANINKVLKELDNVQLNQRRARFVCVLAIARPNQQTTFHKGVCEGKIALSPKGSHGFGYDPIFIPEGYMKTMAQLTPDEKNKISHRQKAISQLEPGFLT
ncbi:XTP/dITP diphosphatase [Lentibacillus sp. Marseille-P4043]|uniref:XTP/dITP diphosphatase n=1 Tax=Lentibacillus sp. Marseille-P4043 TaxID=2040293 RepID=UPI000D0BC50F|nr:XTP/dITP diphosphatase [Lentibacillus sp. Marseille-P4043]